MKGLSDMDRTQIENKAKELLGEMGYTFGVVDIVGIAKKLGFVVANAEVPDNLEGFIIIDRNHDKILGIETQMLIGVNSEYNLPEKRFIVAHEIGHYLLHYDQTRDTGLFAHRDHKTGKNDKENDVDYFAAVLLMPEGEFRKKYKEDNRISVLSNYFNVPHASAERRVKELGL